MVKWMAQWKEPVTWSMAATADRFLVPTYFSESGNGETFLEGSNITKGAGSLILVREKRSLWNALLHMKHTGSLFEFCHNRTMSGTELWRLLGDNKLGKNKLLKQTEMLESF